MIGDIWFRGKRVDTGEWIEGYFVKLYDCDGHGSFRIYPGLSESDCGDFYPDWYEVDPYTVGQFTGLRDKNNVNICEGDIVKFTDDVFGRAHIGRVIFRDGAFPIMTRIYKLIFHQIGHPDFYHDMGSTTRIDYIYEVIGNIHDNPAMEEAVEKGSTKKEEQ